MTRETLIRLDGVDGRLFAPRRGFRRHCALSIVSSYTLKPLKLPDRLYHYDVRHGFDSGDAAEESASVRELPQLLWRLEVAVLAVPCCAMNAKSFNEMRRVGGAD